jgi:GNAT superfamily N-acetyltransferase
MRGCVEIVRATEHDVYAVACAMKEFETCTDHVKVDVNYTTGRYVPMVKSGTCAIFMLKDGNKVCGAIGGIKAEELHCGEMIAVETFWFVSPAHRGQGLRLLELFEEWARVEKCEKVAMIHLQDSMPETLKKLYERRGYRLIESHYVREVAK